MFSKTRTNTGTTGSTRTSLRSVPGRGTAKVGTDAEDKMWEALHANPNSTVADLASAAKIGKSTAGKILAKWDKDGSVIRTPGIAEGGRRAADLWAITDTGTAVDSDPVDHNPAGDTDMADTEQVDATDPEPTDAEPAHDDSAETRSAGSTDSATEHALEPTGAAATGPAMAEPVVAEVITPATDSAAADGNTVLGSTNKDSGEGKAARLVPGELRGMVEDYLRDHPGEEFGPAAIAQALGGKSSGAVSNALDKLTAEGTAVQTKDKPRRYRISAGQDV